MARVRITREFSFEMSHALEGYDGLCSQIHGHSYRLFVTVEGEPAADPADSKLGMVMDFGELKRIVNSLIVDRFDHAMVVRQSENNREMVGALKKNFSRVVTTDYQPTCENMIVRFAEILKPELPAHVRLFSIKMHETERSFAEWFADDNL